jgi:hypothetical protein
MVAAKGRVLTPKAGRLTLVEKELPAAANAKSGSPIIQA